MTTNHKNLAASSQEDSAYFVNVSLPTVLVSIKTTTTATPTTNYLNFFLNFLKEKHAEQENLCGYSFILVK